MCDKAPANPGALSFPGGAVDAGSMFPGHLLR